MQGRFAFGMRTLGLDVGTKTIGVALSDELGLTAQGRETLRRTALKADLAQLTSVAKNEHVGRIVVGLPLNMDGSEGPRAEATRKFAAAVEEALGLPVELWDERLTTAEAERVLLAADVSRKKRKAVIDRLAAQLILQSWLDAHRSEPT